ncbi:MAG: hypothetical protein DWQ01_16280 [Planctomycetota bacterium]|nr:MAG: hypothetical protein DWQ01_16280 [Planctomycetota bacterium]
MKSLIRWRGWCILALFWAGAVNLAGQDQPLPANIVVLLADDLGWGDVSYHNATVRTPNLERLRQRGLELDQQYVMPQCTPTRVALLSGRYPSRFGLHACQASNARSLPPKTPTLASLLQAQGYATGLFGKWHLGSKMEWGPKHYGFDFSYGSLAGAVGMLDHRYRLNSPYSRTWHRNHEWLQEEGHVTDLTVREVLAFLQRNRNQPFFLYVPFHTVHTPLVEEAKWFEGLDHVTSKDRKLYLAAVRHLDWAVGQIVAEIDRLQLSQRTYILFLSDNGAQVRHSGNQYPAPDPALKNFSSNAPLRGEKTQVYEGGIRVPALLSGPGIEAGSRFEAPLHAVDWLPTFLAAAGGEVRMQNFKLDGQNLLPWLQGKASRPLGPRNFYWLWGSKGQRAAVRRGPWKWLRNGANRPWELYRIDQDPLETKELSAQFPEEAAACQKFFQQMQAMDAP